MKTDYMVIGRVRNSENILRLVKGIEGKGYSCYNFLNKPCTPDSGHLPWGEQMDKLEAVADLWNDPHMRYIFEMDMEALRNADTIVMLLPAGMAAHMEAGVAYGLNKKMVLIGEVEKPETLYLMFEQQYPNIESFLETI